MTALPDGPDGVDGDLTTLPYGICVPADDPRPRVCVRVGADVLDLAAALGDPVFAAGDLNAFLARGPAFWASTRDAVRALAADPERARDALRPLREVELRLPVAIGDYVDFYASEHHASNVGRMFRPDEEPLTPNWKHLPIGYHGRAGTIAVSGTPVVRPSGQRKPPGDAAPVFGPTQRLDIEAEVGFVVGAPSRPGEPVPAAAFAEHVFGVVLVNDWSARDVQPWEYRPLGPFLAKSFATTMSAWVVPLDALAAARVEGPPQDPPVLPHLARGDRWGLDLALEVRLDGEVVSRPPFRTMYWTPDQMLAHLTSNGATVRTGDLYASGTVSGPDRDQRGSLLELSWGGREPFTLADGTTRTFLEDGDEVVITATAPGPDGAPVHLGEVAGRIAPAR